MPSKFDFKKALRTIRVMLFNLNNSGVTDNAGINWDYSNPDSINTHTNMIIIINNLSLVGAISEQQSVNFSFQI